MVSIFPNDESILRLIAMILIEQNDDWASGDRYLCDISHSQASSQELDVKLSRYKWRSTELIRGDTLETKRYWFRPPEDLRWTLLRPLVR